MTPTLVDYVQNRRGKVIWPANWRPCERCNAPDWDGKAMPRPTQRWRQAIDAMTAYQMVHITEGVIQRGTATVLRDLAARSWARPARPPGPTDVWFVGGTPQMIGGLYIGFDAPEEPGRRGAGRHLRRADLQVVRGQGVQGPAGHPVPRAAGHPHGAHRPR